MMTSISIPRTMKAWQYSSTAGGIEKNLVLNQNVPVPSLAPYIGARDSVLLVRVLSASLNPVDYKVPELGIVSRAVTGMQATPGLDFCGRVVQSTPTVDDFAVGDLVFGHLDFQQHGTTGEYIVVPTKHCARVPEGVSIDEAATLGVAAVTAYQSISGYVKQGDKVFLNGGSGGTGTFGIQIAKALGCHVTVSCSPAKAELCRSLGADEIIDYTSVDLSRELKAKGQVFSLVVDNVGTPSDLYKASDDFLLPTGRFVQVGVPMSLNTVKMIASRSLLPSFLGGGKRTYIVCSVRHDQDALRQLAQWVAERTVKVVIEKTYDMEDLPKAFAKLKEGRNAGKLVIHIGKE